MNQPAARIFENVPSPFCGIASDDLRIEVNGTGVTVLENGCAVTKPAFEAPLGDPSPRIDGKPATLEAAITRIAQGLGGAHLPLFSGFGTDVDATRAALSLIDRCRGVFDQARAEGSMRNLAVLQDSGWMATTLGEVKNRVDLLLVVGSDIESAFPRFYERFVWNPETLYGQDTKTRQVVCLGRAPSGSAAVAPDGRGPEVIGCAQDDLPAVIAALGALARGAQLQAETVAGIPLTTLQGLVERLWAARYGVITWIAGQWQFPHADLAVQQLNRMIFTFNQKTRCSALPLGGQEGERTASQVCAWITGYPTRVGYLRGYPEHDPHRFATRRLLDEGEADALVWVSNLGLNPPPACAVPTYVIGRSGMTFEREPEAYIPVGCPGIDHAGHMYRCDNVVALPLYPLRDSGLPRAADVLAAIERAL